MLGFFRRYQKIFFIGITVVIIISFSFFGGMGRMGPQQEDRVAFKAINGKEVKRSELGQLIVFLGTDADDKNQAGGDWRFNGLNDGVVRKDILQTGLAEILAAEYLSLLDGDLKQRADRERHFTPYSHPKAHSLNAASTWSYFAPAVSMHLAALRNHPEPTSHAALARRVQLYLAEQAFPQSALKQVLHYQEQQANWIQPDPYLFQKDLSLFGYHTLEDWFGPHFVTLVAEFIYDAAILAEEQGYRVSEDEVWADLQRNGDLSFQRVRQSPLVQSKDSAEFLTEQLHHLGMGRGQAVRVWKQVLLFRRLFQDVGQAALIDHFAFNQFHHYAGEAVEVALYSVPEEVQLKSGKDLQAFEAYLDAVSARRSDLPTELLSLDAIARKAPELVQKNYTLDVVQISKPALTTRIPLKELWDWELSHWDQISKAFPALAAEGREERFAVLEAADRTTREKIDGMAHEAIIAAHPEWVEEALDRGSVRSMTVGLSKGSSPLPAISDNEKLMALLDSAPLGRVVEESPLYSYTQDGKTYFRISVFERDEKPHLLTFAEAQEHLADRKPANFEATLKRIYDDYKSDVKHNITMPSEPTADFCALHRFHHHLREAKQMVKQGQELVARDDLTDQWRVVSSTKLVQRSDGDQLTSNLYEMEVGEWSLIVGNHFFQVADRTVGAPTDSRSAHFARDALSAEAQRYLMVQVLEQIKNRSNLAVD